MELGGNAPFIVFDDADLDAAVQGALASKYRNAGQTCVCANRLFVQEGIHDTFVARLKQAVEAMTVGHGNDEATVIGPLIDHAAVEKVEEHIADALAKGARVAVGGQRHDLGGSFFQPTILTEARRDMLIFDEETFGPVAPIFKFNTEAEVIEQANDTPFGLAAYVYTRDLARTWRVTEQLEFGIVAVNDGIVSTEAAPFGGVKESGTGREGGKYGLEDFLEVKYILHGGIAAAAS
jgi:succinate-semialdehyde dehydrogenase/glutarate-semialdehyde dehydrogenase